MSENNYIENLRETLLWEVICSVIETTNQIKVIMNKAKLNNITIENACIQDSEVFDITNTNVKNDKIIIDFKMPFILLVNREYNIEAVAIGTLSIPSKSHFAYDTYDFLSMNKKELLEHKDIVNVINIDYEGVEILEKWHE